MDQVKFFKGCPPQILLGSLLNTLFHLLLALPLRNYNSSKVFTGLCIKAFQWLRKWFLGMYHDFDLFSFWKLCKKSIFISIYGNQSGDFVKTILTGFRSFKWWVQKCDLNNLKITSAMSEKHILISLMKTLRNKY